MAADDLARMRAEADQNREQMRELGRNLRGFFDGCVESGFDEAQALQLTSTLLTLRRMLGDED